VFTEEMNNLMEEEVSEAEVQADFKFNAKWKIGHDKFTVEFFKSFYDIQGRPFKGRQRIQKEWVNY
jgi:hypothetical protein